MPGRGVGVVEPGSPQVGAKEGGPPPPVSRRPGDGEGSPQGLVIHGEISPWLQGMGPRPTSPPLPHPTPL